MKRKGLLALFALTFGLCSLLGLLGVEKSKTDYSVVSAAGEETTSLSGDKLWDGSSVGDVSDTDFYKSGNDYYIYTAKGFVKFAQSVNAVNGQESYSGKTIHLETDVDLGGHAWTPIANVDNRYFQGTFNGNGHYIYNLNVSGNFNNAGLFGSISGAGGTILNLNLRNINITGKANNVGGLVGRVASTATGAGCEAVRYCSVSGKMNLSASGNYQNVGGVIGTVSSPNPDSNGKRNVNTKISNLKSSVYIDGNGTAELSCVGGIVGEFIGVSIDNASFDGEITNHTKGYIGGIVGWLAQNPTGVKLTNVYNTAKISSVQGSISSVGGIIGRSETQTKTGVNKKNELNNSYNAGEVNGDNYRCGLVGFIGGMDNFAIKNSFNTGVVKGATRSIGQTIGDVVSGGFLYYSVENDVLLNRVYDQTLYTSSNYGVKEIVDWAKTKGFYANKKLWGNNPNTIWDFENTWDISASVNSSMPYLKFLDETADSDVNAQSTATNLLGSGKKYDPYRIYSVGDLTLVRKMSSTLGKYFSLQNDIDLSERAWQPIVGFAGVFDGNGYTIYGLVSSHQSDFGVENFGVFGSTSSAVIKNLNVKNVKYLSDGSSVRKGAIIGNVVASTYLVNCTTDYETPVGHVENNSLHVYFGKANIEGKVEDVCFNVYTPEGYVVETNVNGGRIYYYDNTSQTSKYIYGQYQTLLKKDGSQYKVQNATSFENLVLPTRSPQEINPKISVANYIVNEGYYLKSYKTAENTEVSVDTIAFELPLRKEEITLNELVFTAQYEERNVDVRIVKNEYEVYAGFATTEVYEERTFGYDDILTEVWPEITSQARENYTASYYTSFSNGNFSKALRIDDRMNLADGQTHKNIYVKWTGTTEENYTFTINLNKSSDVESRDYAAKNKFNFSEVLNMDSIYLQKYESTTDNSGNKFTAQLSGNKIVIRFNTKYSDRMENFLRLNFALKEGYHIQGVYFNEDDYGDFGEAKVKELVGSNFSEDEISLPVSRIDKLNKLAFLNLSDDYSCNITIERDEYEKDLTLSGDFNFAIGPKYDVVGKKVSIYGEEYGITFSGEDERYVGFNFDTLRLISNDNAFENLSITNFSENADNIVSFGERNYLFSDDGDGLRAVYLLNSSPQIGANGRVLSTSIQDTIVKIVKTIEDGNAKYSFQYFYNQDFVFIAMAKDIRDTISIQGGLRKRIDKDHDEDVPANRYSATIIPVTSAGQTNNSKGYAVFTGAVEYSNKDYSISSKATIVDLSFEFVLEEKDGEGNITGYKKILENAPTIVAEHTMYDVEQAGTFKFVVNPSEYYRFKQDADRPNSVYLNNQVFFINPAKEIPEGGDESSQYEINGLDDPGTFDTQNNINEISFNYDTSFPAARYIVRIVCEEVKYDINFNTTIDGILNTQTMKYTDMEIISQKEVDGVMVWDEENAKTFDYYTRPTGVSTGTAYTDNRASNKFAFNSKIRVKVVAPNHAYFLRWFEVVNGNRTNAIQIVEYDDTSTTLEFVYSDMFIACECADFVMNVRSVFTRKVINFELYQNQIWDKSNGQIATYQELGIESGVSGLSPNQYTYTIGLENTAYKGVSITALTGENAAGYEYAGYRIYCVNDEGEVVPVRYDANHDYWESEDVLASYNFNFLVDRMTQRAYEYQGRVSQSYYLVPVVVRKEITLVFHSGTGLLNEYGDGRNGHVYNTENQETTNNTGAFASLTKYTSRFGEEVDITDISSFGSSDAGFNLREHFSRRTGYRELAQTEFMAYTGNNGQEVVLFDNNILLGNDIFESVHDEGDDKNVVHIYFRWSANNYNINFNANDGTFAPGSSNVVNVFFDQTLPNIPQVDRVGYDLLGWKLYVDEESPLGPYVIEKDGSEFVFCEGDYFDADGKYIYDGEITLVAVWEARHYKVRVYQNSANVYYKNGVRKTEGEGYEDYDIVYDSTFANIYADYATNRIPTRKDFRFLGIYANSTEIAGRNQIAEDTIFDQYIETCDLTQTDEPNLNLYVAWEFDGDYSISFESQIEELKYTAESQLVYVGSFLTTEGSSFVYNGYQNVAFNSASGLLEITISDELHATLTMYLNDEEETEFSVRDAGVYTKTFKIVVEDNAEYYNCGTIIEEIHTFSVGVLKASIDTEASIDENLVKLASVKNIMKGLVSDAEYQTIQAFTNIENFADYIRDHDNTANSASDENIYKFVMLKFYNQLVDADYLTYKNWKYSDYQTYYDAHQEDAERTISNLRFVSSYIYTDNGKRRDISDYTSAFKFKSVDGDVSDSKIRSELSISSVKINGNASGIEANSTAELYIYFSASEETLNNYSLLEDENGNTYFEIASIYILPQILQVANSESSGYSYYDETLSCADIEWFVGRNEAEAVEGQTYYQITDDLFMKAKLYTSNGGSGRVDTDYTAFGVENVLYYSNVDIYRKVGNEYQFVSDRFKVLADKNDIYKILSTKDFYRVNISAQYLTTSQGQRTSTEISTDVAQNLLRIIGVAYYTGSDPSAQTDPTKWKQERSDDFLEEKEYRVSAGGMVLFKIVHNNDNNVSIFAHKVVKRISVVLTTKYITENIRFHKWSDTILRDVDGPFEENGGFDILTNGIEMNEDKETEVNYYATFTDLVEVVYNLNFPEDYPTRSVERSVLKLGVSTIDDLFIPNEGGFEFVTFNLKDTTGVAIDYTTLFTGPSDTFKGLTEKHARLELDVVWKIGDILTEQKVETINLQVGTLYQYSMEEIVSITNKSNDLFTYTYVWKKGTQIVSEGENLSLENGGITTDSGEYSLTISAKVKERFKNVVPNPTDAEDAVVEFTINLMPHKITQIELVGEDTAIYDSYNHSQDWTIDVRYLRYNNETGEYYQLPDMEEVFFTTDDVLSAETTKGGNVVDEMVNVGQYSIHLSYNTDYYVVESGTELDFDFVFEITPFVLDIDGEISPKGKYFNGDNEDIKQTFSTGFEELEIEFSRQAGEDIGEYRLYLKDVASQSKGNYTIVCGEDVIFENSTPDTTIVVGTFTISCAGEIKLSYETDASTRENLEVVYNPDGYTIALTDSFKLQIFNGETKIKDIQLKLYDVANQKEITNSTILNILKTKVSDITPYFNNSVDIAHAIDCGVYAYTFNLGQQISNYYTTIRFETGYQFTIKKQELDVETFNLDKVYDGKTIAYIDLNGDVIPSIENYEDVYILATYESPYANPSVNVLLNVVGTGEENIANYELSAPSTTATISKLSATGTIATTKASYVYGEVRENNFESLLQSIVLYANGQNVTNLLNEERYTISYALPSLAQANTAGCLYVGTYTIDVSATFEDFDVSITEPQIQVAPLNVVKNLNKGAFKVVAPATRTDNYVDVPMTISETGDSITLSYYTYGITNPSQLIADHFYNLQPETTSFANGSVLVSVPTNEGLEILANNNIVEARIVNTGILTQTYNGSEYEFSVNLSTQTFEISNGANTYTSALTFWEESTQITISDFSEIEVYSPARDGQGQEIRQTEFTTAGTNKLAIYTRSNSYPIIIFKQDYNFEIEKKAINVSNLSVSKIYDGNMNYTITTFAEKVGEDDVSIVARFENANVGTNKNISLSLVGEDAGNYQLSSASMTGDITKQTAVVTIDNLQYTYGDLSNTSTLQFSVYCGDNKVGTSEYNIEFTIVGATYSTQWNYLFAGQYSLQMTGSSDNYNLTFDNSVKLVVSKYALDVVFETSGVVSVEYGETNPNTFNYTYRTPIFEDVVLQVTRQNGLNVGFYRALSSTTTDPNFVISSTTDNSDGMYRITKSSVVVFLLLSNEEEITSSTAESVAFAYDGNIYNQLQVRKVSDEYKLVITDGANEKMFALNTYIYDGSKYVKTAKTLQNLTSVLSFAEEEVKNVGIYRYLCESAQAENYNVSLMKTGQVYNNIVINPKELRFKEETITRTFDNKDAIYIYEDADELVDGVVDGEEVGLKIEFFKNAERARYVGQNYVVQAELVGENEVVSNYQILTLTADETQVNGTIEKAEMKIYINSVRIVYGEDYTLSFDYTYDEEIDLTGYDMTRIDIRLHVVGEQTSTANKAKVGEYRIEVSTDIKDFSPTFNVDGVEKLVYSNEAKVVVSKKDISYTATSGTLGEAFTKKYDGNTNCSIQEGGVDKFALDGVLTGDAVYLESAEYASYDIGNTIEVELTLGGADADNYRITNWSYGVIEPIVVSLRFDYNANGSTAVHSNTEIAGIKTITKLAFPFVSISYITSNSYENDTMFIENFPTSLSGYTGYTFKAWMLRFTNVEENSQKYEFLSALAEELLLKTAYENEIFDFYVGNNAASVSLLNKLMRDDTDNIAGMYYLENENPIITFTADWSEVEYSINVRIADENGRTAAYGTAESGGEVIDRAGTIVSGYNREVSILATPLEHCTYVGFYDADEGYKYDTAGAMFVNVTRDGATATLTISKMTKSYNIVVRFKAQSVRVEIPTTDPENTSTNIDGFVEDEGKIIWTTNYFELGETSLEDVGLERVGYVLNSITIAGTTYLPEQFEDVVLQDLVVGENDQVLTLTPNFESVGVVVTLNYGYNDLTENIAVAFESAYNTSAGWVETPEREGYNFLGWYNYNGQRVIGSDVMATTNTHTLTARWEIASFTLTLEIENGTMEFEEQEITSYETELQFNETLTFIVKANNGYHIPSASELPEEISSYTRGEQIYFVVIMPGRDYSYTIRARADENIVVYSGENVGVVQAYDITEGEEEIIISANRFAVETGRTIRMVVHGATGYLISGYSVSVDTLDIDEDLTGGVLTLEISGILGNVAFTFETQEDKHYVAVGFENPENIESFVYQERNYYNFEDISIEVPTGEDLTFVVKYKHGYRVGTYQTQSGYDVDIQETTILEEKYYEITISNILIDGEITFEEEIESYTITLEVISINDSKQQVFEEQNRVKIADNNTMTITKEFGEEIELAFVSSNVIYNFAGWSKNGTIVFSNDRNTTYTIEDDETIYAIFSAIKINVTLKTLNYYTLYSEYMDPEMLETHYDEIENVGEEYFEDEEKTKSITKTSIYYGSSKNIYYDTPVGYRFYGHGYKNGEDFVYLSKDDGNSRGYINISTLGLDEEQTEITIYMVVRALSSRVFVKTEIDVEGEREENRNVGSIKLVDGEGADVNEYGYVEGTRVHYSLDDYTDGELVNNKEFTIIACTGEEIFIRAKLERAGFVFYGIAFENENMNVSRIADADDGDAIYKIVGVVGGENCEISVLFRPTLNKISIDFAVEEDSVDGGAFNYETAEPRKVFSSGIGYSTIEMSAYTDSSFKIYAYIDMGYLIDPDNIQFVDESGLVVASSVAFEEMDIYTTGYMGVITFVVADYFEEATIRVVITPRRYVVHLVEDGSVLATIRNVEYSKLINVNKTNEGNISVYDDRLVYAGGKLNLKLNKQGYTYEGFFSYENGAGVRYINSDGLPSLLWQDTGYYYDIGSSTYKLTTNARINEQTGDMEISIFLYWSYLKTRIIFTLVPSVPTLITAQDMVEGVDYTNSWFYKDSPYYIEVAFNTSINITAPEMDGYKFYKFVISQKNKNGEVLKPVSTSQTSVPWVTNELDAIVEVNIQVVYYVKIDVVVYGGEGYYDIVQETKDTQAEALLRAGYVDSTIPFMLRAVPKEGYTFVRWNNITSGRSSIAPEWDRLYVTAKTTFVMNLQGDYVTIKFTSQDSLGNEVPYDYTHGQIMSAIATSINNTSRSFRIGSKIRNVFTILLNEIEVKVGDVVTFAVEIDGGFAALWNRDDVRHTRYADGKYYFELTISPEMSENHYIRLLPNFQNEIMAIYVNRDFVEEQKGLNAVDADNVNLAGFVLYNSRRTNMFRMDRGQDMTIGFEVNPRYSIDTIVIGIGEREIDLMPFYDKGKISLTTEYIEENQVVGTLRLQVMFRRLLWEEKVVEVNLEGEGTKRNPYEISSVEELVFVMQKVNSGAKNLYGEYYSEASYVLKKDLKIGAEFWTPIGTIEHAFNGRFNFNKHQVTAIYNPYLYVDTSYDGLFGVIGERAVIEGGKAEVWYWYLIGAAVLALTGTAITIIYIAKRNKKRMEKMSVK